ncbi:MAG TPA: CmcI family methyltransferase [Isosphaeraceae bacterium]|jgi:cephalosporin hydroxylase|nr:CmcI family methyltransferase [Isosphaeraceae bacterium]
MSNRALSIAFATLATILGIFCVLFLSNPLRFASGKQLADHFLADHPVVDQFHKLYYDNPETWSTRWLGLETLQNPNDVWMIQEIICEVRPDLIIEAGTRAGGSAAIWAMVLQQVNPNGRVITIDIKDYVPSEARDLPIIKEKVDFLLGSSTDPKIVDEIRRRTEGKKVLVILDSDHSKNHVLNEMIAYGPMVTKGSYMIVQDTNINGHPVLPDFGPGPWEALDEYLPKNEQFQPDKSRERLMFTMHPRGFLRRIE